jgi:hypothetical protein
VAHLWMRGSAPIANNPNNEPPDGGHLRDATAFQCRRIFE